MGEEEDVKSERSKDKVLTKKSKTGAKDQKSYITSLKDKDPDFFEFLKENDEELLNFDESSEDEDDEDKEREKGAHKPPEKLEVASDESDFEDDEVEASGSRKKLNQAQVNTWLDQLTKQPNLSLIQDIIEGFRGAVASIGSGEKSEEAVPLKYIVEGGSLFNSVVRLCVVNLEPALKKVLKIEPDSHMKPEKAKKMEEGREAC